MPLSPTVTLGEATDDVLEALGFADLGTARTRALRRVERFIRQAVAEIAPEAEWDGLRAELRIPLVQGQARYEFPEEVNVGDLGVPLVLRQDGSTYELTGGLRPQDRGDVGPDQTYGVPTGAPDRFRFIDGEIELYPAPNPITAFTHLLFVYKKALPPLRDPDEQLPFEPELIIQRATWLGRVHYQKPGVDDIEKSFLKLLARLKAKQGPMRTFFVGGRKSHWITADKRVPRDGGDTPSVGTGAPAGPDWHPW